MRIFIHTFFLLVWWAVLKQTRAGGDNLLAPVSGTGWTDITQLQSTCSTPGYFVNPSDCSKFYVCVDHSSAEKKLLLRYDFDCPGGLAFDESTQNCNYPGPSGCVTSSSGWGWSNQRESGPWQNTATVTRVPNSWGTPTRNPVIIRTQGIPGETILRLPTTPAPIASNPRVNIPTRVHVVQIPVDAWESLRLRPATKVIQSARESGESGGWSSAGVSNTGVFQSARVTTQQGPNPSVTWGTSKIYPVQTPGFKLSTRVTPVPPTEWETPKQFPRVVQVTRVEEQPGNGWSRVRVTPTPSPAPANPSVTPSVVWHSARISPRPNNAITYERITTQVQQQQSRGWNAPQTHNSVTFVQNKPPTPNNPTLNVVQSRYQVAHNPSVNYVQSSAPVPNNPSLNFIQGPPPNNPSVNFIQGPPPNNPSVNFIQGSANPANNPSYTVIQGSSDGANPTLNIVRTNSEVNPTVNVPAGWGNFRLTQLPSGYIWQSSPDEKSTQTKTFVASTPNPPTSLSSGGTGDFGIVQQVINEENGQGSVNGKSHIQLVYESKEKQLVQHQTQIIPPPHTQEPQEISSKDPRNPIYQFVSPQDSSFRGRIIVLYAPLNNKGGKREVPVVEVEVEDDNDNDDDGNNESTENN